MFQRHPVICYMKGIRRYSSVTFAQSKGRVEVQRIEKCWSPFMSGRSQGLPSEVFSKKEPAKTIRITLNSGCMVPFISFILLKWQGFLLCQFKLSIYLMSLNFKVALKVDSHLSKKKMFYLLQGIPFSLMKSAFYFILKLFLFSRCLHFFCLDFLVMQEKQLDQKYKVNFKIYDVTT